MSGYRVGRPVLVHYLEPVPVLVPGEVRRNLRPAAALILTAEEEVGSHVDALMVRGADQDWCVPVPAVGQLTLTRVWLDAYPLSALAVIA